MTAFLASNTGPESAVFGRTLDDLVAADGGALEKMLPPFRMGVGGPVGSGEQYLPWVSLDDAVDAIYNKARELGAADEGEPGPRGDGFYAGYFRDLDGNKLNAFFIG